jgi:hypothetical protein
MSLLCEFVMASIIWSESGERCRWNFVMTNAKSIKRNTTIRGNIFGTGNFKLPKSSKEISALIQV